MAQLKSMCKSDVISEKDMLALVNAAAQQAGSPNRLAVRLGMRSAAPLYLALQGERPLSDDISIRLGYVKEVVFRRISNAA